MSTFLHFSGNKSAFWVLLACFVVLSNVYAQDEGVTEANAETEATSEAAGKDADEAEQCNKARKGCCSETNLGDQDLLMKCFVLHQNKMPADGEKDLGKAMKFLSCLVECIYKKKKYIGKGDTVNMKMVKNDAEKMFPNRPKEQVYHVQKMEHCRKEAVPTYNLVKSSPAGIVLLKGACKPFFMFVFLCETDYHTKKSCPYFKWEGKRKTPAEEECKEAKDKCYVLDGITPPE